MDEVEAVLTIRGYQRRLERWDDLLASVKATLIQPHLKKNKKADPKKYRTIRREDEGPEPEAEVIDLDERRERFRRLREGLGAEAIPVDVHRMRHQAKPAVVGDGPVPLPEP